jgi:proline dehydrogenase
MISKHAIMKHIDFNNTEVAFAYRNRRDLIRAYNMFYLMKYNWLVKVGTDMTMKAWDRGVTFPISIMMKPTVYKLFCGGESLDRSTERIEQLYKYGVQVVLDYGIEAKETDEDFDRTAAEVKRAIHYACEQTSVPVVSSKFSGLIRYRVLEKLHAGEQLTREEMASFQRSKDRIDSICQLAHQYHVGLFIDAEESWIQQPLDELAHEMMEKYNRDYPVVFNTIQLYLRDRVAELERQHLRARAGKYIYGIKLVRGAYMEKESERAAELGYADPIQPDKASCDRDYDEAVKYCLDNLDDLAVCIATHNEESCRKAATLMEANGIEAGDKRVYFSQLYGMSDHISFNLVRYGFNVAKYMPYGPVTDVIPYLVRRAQENTSVSGQMGRELSLLRTEMRRRNLMLF